MTTSKARRKAKGRYSDTQRLDWYEKKYDDVYRTLKGKFFVIGRRRQFAKLRAAIDAAMRLESKARLVRVRRGGK